MELGEIKGLGAKRIENLKRSGIESVNDLIMLFPSAYIDLSVVSEPAACVGMSAVTLLGKVTQAPSQRFLRKRLILTTAVFTSEGGSEFECGWFNRRYLKNTLQIGKIFYIHGKVERYGKKLSVRNATLLAYSKDLPEIYPVYKAIKGVPSSVLTAAIDKVLDSVKISSFLSREISEKYDLMDLNYAFKCLHRPPNMSFLEKARLSVAVENLACNIALYSLLKQSAEKSHAYADKSRELSEFIEKLPFKLSKDQTSALKDILADMSSDRKMNRLLQGDVGCGKTIVALTAMLYAAMSGFQSALMSPTELLAKQHYDTAVKLFKDYDAKIEFLSSSTSPSEKRNILSRIASGESKVIIGTHALIQEDVCFHNLSLIVTDEQQRFGVKQRGMLENKALNADYLVMTATPIPRTLALTLYGDLEQSEIHTLPLKKANIQTRYVPNKKLDDMLDYVFDKAACGEQTFLICPRIEEDDELVSVEKLYDELLASKLKPYLGKLHGQQSDEEKQKTMAAFAAGRIKVLVTTSIIEVGIDVPNATTIIIFNAERYGLSQLHQLRGRVGRGSIDSYCFLLTDMITQSKTKERLDYFISCSDGFQLAEYDFKLRGAGDFLGTRQHGDSLLSVINKPIIETAKAISFDLAGDDGFRRKIMEQVGKGQLSFIEKLTLN